VITASDRIAAQTTQSQESTARANSRDAG